MSGGVSRGKTLERTCPYEKRIPVSNARRDPMWLADDSARICELNGCTCILENGETCPEFPQEDEQEFLEDPSNLTKYHEGIYAEVDLWEKADQKWKADHENEE